MFKNKLLLLVLFLILILSWGGVFFYFQNFLSSNNLSIKELLKERVPAKPENNKYLAKDFTSTSSNIDLFQTQLKKIEKITKKVESSTPLIVQKETAKTYLSREGILYFTNLYRQKANLNPLKENTALNEAATKKAKDILTRQYFQHTSPTGEDAGYLAEESGYKYLLIGENLALGNFENDEDLVKSWMASPGHRKNILNSSYQDIGIGVEKGTFKDQQVWVAVQIFGTPIDVCPQPKLNILYEIKSNLEKLDTILQTLSDLKKEIDALPAGMKRIRKISEYNKLVNEYNKLAKYTEDLVKNYNDQVNEFNICVANLQ